MEPVKKFSPVFYGVIVLLFFLPFVNLSCGGQTIMSITGFQLITGTEVKASGMFGEMNSNDDLNTDQKKEIESQPLALFAFLSALIGLIVSFFKMRIPALINIVISIAGVVFLLLLKVSLDGDADLNVSGQNVITLDYQFAYWFSIILFIAGAVVQWKIFADEGPSKVNVLG
ncbi:MAG: hypothetical protein MUF28_05385 [Ignavibacterium sp.]|jgi:hypothetical protein|nr:hypothetical protein [Ignavibacterium sp.]